MAAVLQHALQQKVAHLGSWGGGQLDFLLLFQLIKQL